ncbi:glycosyl hydrolase family 18 [Microbacterium sp. zg.B48]|uniref:chitinase n=1 Tax=Microbacterium sp. zg.B48 TaxID=2969408 RepID=UPI00214ACBAC|nr:carbohydrate-binding protein [Microbacterium sp. zg.B48]MCR2763278.1 glycosyl hydrolase family 18 [Microbacterium sp. zg.B48]
MTRSTGRHAGQRLSPWRVSAAVIAVLAVVGAGIAVPMFANGQASAESTVKAAPRWFGGYFDVTAAPVSEMPTSASGAPSNVVLAFIVAEAEDSCVPSWGTYYGLEEAATALDLDRRVARMRQKDAEVAVSFGGALNTELAGACRTVDDLADAYEAVIDRYDIEMIDLDVEGENLADTVAGVRRAEAVAQLQEKRRKKGEDLIVWLTLPVATHGLTDAGLASVDQMLTAGVELGGVNVMTMDYGIDLEGASMADAAISALKATHTQLSALYRRHEISLPRAGAWSVLGATPMIGQNDVAGEVFTLDDAEELNDFAAENSLDRMSMWSVNRDRTCGANYPNTEIVSDSCSGVDQGDRTFAALLSAGFDGRPTSTPAQTQRPAPVVKDDPDTSPYPVWSKNLAYSTAVRVVWHGNVYAAKWWTRGGAEPDDPTLDGTATAWTLVGPVLRDDEPFSLPTAAPGTYPEWSATGIYVAGDRVLYKGTAFVAKWWTQGEDPSLGITDHDRSPWELVEAEAETEVIP